ncbi:LysM peptidoglycan-binding domain-containing protein [Fodinisporobacter ferrooxydans]|uniref:LysM peptidoglycan-binding domain-containing protein n=1 Tax=Fodinisporobacter ferrooxydans TaxID=2901836 RepID=A0ABY4CHJ4_9BACL|nr:LysM peptidoglycan-binding domain-containing protein [Alicyclobacillaceae bacterium MYW30-H2]
MLKKLLAIGLGISCIAFGGQAFAATYQIHANDTLWKLSQTFHVSVSELQKANPGIDPENLQTGQSIQIPGYTTYTATDTDTFWTIAQSYHVPVSDLLAANPTVDPSNIYAGLALNIPAAPNTAASGQAVAQATASAAAMQSAAATSGQTANASTGQNVATAANGQTFQYSQEISAKATAYTASAASNGSWGAVDYFGNPLKLGTVAVDPSVIPLGSKLYITGYSFNGLPTGGMFATASDVGGGIQGNHIDMFIPTSDANASNFGIQNVKVYIVK